MVKKYKKDDKISYALGATLVMELLNKRPELAKTVYVSPKCDIDEVVSRAGELGVPVEVSEKAINILSPKGNCFAIGLFDKFTASPRADRHHVVLVNPSDSGNLGTIMRTVAAFDCADLVIIRPAVDPFDPKTVRASMGAVFNISFTEYDSFDEYIKDYPAHRVVPFMLGGSDFSDIKFLAGENGSEKCTLVFGNEATGLPAEFTKFGAVKIEQSETVDSLNLSTAVAIALYKLYTEKY